MTNAHPSPLAYDIPQPTVYAVRGYYTYAQRTYRWEYIAGAGEARAKREIRRLQAINAKAGRIVWKDIVFSINGKIVATY